MLEHNQLWQLFMQRNRAWIRHPDMLLWVFLLPMLISFVLALGFGSEEELPPLDVVVLGDASATELYETLSSSKSLRVIRSDSREDALRLLRTGKVALVVLPGDTPELITDPTQERGRSARLAVKAALQQTDEAAALKVDESNSPTGSRYIDFLIPGLLALNLVTNSFHLIGSVLAEWRMLRLLKNLSATPMNRGAFLLAFVLSREVLAAIEITFFVGFAWALLDVQVEGSLVELLAFGLYGTLCVSGLGLMIGAWSGNIEASNSISNLFMFAMILLSGVFFPAENFPDWAQPVIQSLPFTALTEGTRAIMSDGAALSSLFGPLTVLTVWGVGTFLVSLKTFRWVT